MNQLLARLKEYTGNDWIGSPYGDLMVVFEREIDEAAEVDLETLQEYVAKTYGATLEIVGVANGCFKINYRVDDNSAAANLTKTLLADPEFVALAKHAKASLIVDVLNSDRLIIGDENDAKPKPDEAFEKTVPNIKGSKERVQAAIITIRPDEFSAVLAHFPNSRSVNGDAAIYNVAQVETHSAGPISVGLVRAPGQGNLESMAITRSVVQDLGPSWVFVVGIGGALPHEDFALGDVVVSSGLVDLTLEAQIEGQPTKYAASGGRLHRRARAVMANLPAYQNRLNGWKEMLTASRPDFPTPTDDELYGDEDWRSSVREALAAHRSRTTIAPEAKPGRVASSDRLVKSTEPAKIWANVLRDLDVFEMEFAGVYSALFDLDIPSLSIRGISDIVGLKRDSVWTTYACQTAAAFATEFLRIDDLHVGETHQY